MDYSNGRAPASARRQLFGFHLALFFSVLVALATLALSSPASAQSSDATLSVLTSNPPATISPAFAPHITEYTISAHNNFDQMQLGVRPSDNQAHATVNGIPLNAGTGLSQHFPIAYGPNTITIEVTAADGISTMTYTLTVIRSHDPEPRQDATVGVTYATRLTCSAVMISGSLPPGLIIEQTGARTVVSGIPERAGTYTFTCEVTPGDNKIYSIVVHPAPASTDATLSGLTPSAGTLDPAFAPGVTHYAMSVPAATSTITLTPAASDTGATLTVNGMATASGAASAPIALNVGSNTITVVSTAEDGISTATYTIAITRDAPISTGTSLSGLVLSAGALNPAFAPGTTHYAVSLPATTDTFAVTPSAADAGSTLTVNGTALPSGTASAPIPLSMGSNTITVVVTAQGGSTTTYTITVTRGAASISFSQAGGALPEAMAGEDYSMSLSAIGTPPIVYSVSAGSLPEGMQLNASTGELTGPLAEGAEGNYTFTLEARGSDGSSATASFTLAVVERAITVSDKTVEVPAGSTPPNVNLTQGATGGPFTSAVIVSVEPANAGTAEIVDAEPAQTRQQKTAHAPAYAAASNSALYLKFVPNAAYAGRAIVKFQLTSDLGASNVGSVTYNLTYDTAAVARKIDGHVRSFVQRRMSLLASNIGAPDLLERRRASAGEDAATGSVQPNAGELAAGFSTDLARINGARGDEAAEPLLFNVWIDGTLLAHNRDENGDRWGTFGLISAGVDYLATDKALLGVSLHLDHMRDPTEDDVTLTGRGWLAGPYGSFEIVDNVFFNAHLLTGASSNDVDTTFFDGRFDSRRWLLDTSVTGQWQLDAVTTLTPRLRALYFDESVRDYRVSNAAGDTIGLHGFTQQQFRVSFGADFERRIELRNGLTLIPNAGLTGGFAGLDGSGAFGSVASGVTLSNQDKWTTEAGIRFDMEGDGQISTGGRLGFSMRCICN